MIKYAVTNTIPNCSKTVLYSFNALTAMYINICSHISTKYMINYAYGQTSGIKIYRPLYLYDRCTVFVRSIFGIP